MVTITNIPTGKVMAEIDADDLYRADLHGKELICVNLEGDCLFGANLRQADLCLSKLSCADLSFADLREANLRQVDFEDADLCDADLRHADLWYANLKNADLRHADLRGTHLYGADLSGADMEGARLLGVRGTRFIKWDAKELSRWQRFVIWWSTSREESQRIARLRSQGVET